MLADPEGWTRDTAQRLLVERADSAVVPALKKLAARSENAPAQLGALWTLAGLGRLDDRTLHVALADRNPKVRAAAVRLAEPFLKTEEACDFIERFGVLAASDASPAVRLQLALTLGETAEANAAKAMAVIARDSCTNIYIRDALLTGLGGRELKFLERILADGSWIPNGSSARNNVWRASSFTACADRSPSKAGPTIWKCPDWARRSMTNRLPPSALTFAANGNIPPTRSRRS